jgi:uncharacterized Fe-S cluster protein YjdI
MEENPESPKPKAAKSYSNQAIKVFWNSSLCIHSENCVRGLPQVFQKSGRPWINVDAATAAEIAATVSRCPSGALQYELLEGEKPEVTAEATIIEPRPNGPLLVKGRIRLESPDGSLLFEGERVALCRCGQSGNKPFCDGTHQKVGFKA